MRQEQAREYLEEHHIRYILAQFVDIHGVPKTKAVPAQHLDMILTDGAGFAGFSVWGFGMGPHGPDMMYRGDLDTLVKIDWMPGFARIACDGYVKGEPYEYDSRVVCRRAVQRVKDQTGLEVFTGLEPEFYLLKQDAATGAVAPANESDVLEKPCYDYRGLHQSGGFLAELADALMGCGLDVYQIDHEDANGQYEINFVYTDALRSADNYILFKMAAHAIANQHGLVCSFMPKPFADRTGNGTHMHISLGKDGENAFQDDSDPNGIGLSRLAYHFLGGVFKHIDALTAISCPSVNSYKRMVVGGAKSGATWAPVFVCYGDNNRTATVRIPYGRLELRSADSSCNPYLLTAAILGAGLDGIENELDPGEPVNINLYETTEAQRRELGIPNLPQSLHEALEALRADDVIKNALGVNLADEFTKIKAQEWIEYSRSVSDWEIRRYLNFY